MARSWCGFMPQNQSTKEQWSLLEASRAEMEDLIGCFDRGKMTERPEQPEEPEARLPRIHKPR
jgi:hypothetical protein